MIRYYDQTPLDKERFGGGPQTILTMEEMAAVERSLKGVFGLL